MKAILTTGCGCSKMIDIPDNPPPEITLPVKYYEVVDWTGEKVLEKPEYHKRRFKFNGRHRSYPFLNDYAAYIEIK